MKSMLLNIKVYHSLIHLLPTHCMHPSMMNVPELKLLSSSLSICSVSLTTDEDEEDKEGDEEGSQIVNNNNNNSIMGSSICY